MAVSRLAQDVLIDYVVTMMRTAAEESSKRGKLAVDDLIYLVRKVTDLTSSHVRMLLFNPHASSPAARVALGHVQCKSRSERLPHML